MANVLHRTTKEYLESVPTRDYIEFEGIRGPEWDGGNWIVNPDLQAVAGYPSKYWTITGDTVTLMDDIDRIAADAAEVVAVRDQITARAESIAARAIADTNALPSPAGVLASLEQRLRALELKVYGA